MKLRKGIPESEMEFLNERIERFLSSRTFLDGEGMAIPRMYTYKDCDNRLGFAYTSSSMYAGLWICNEEIYIDCECKVLIRGFALTTMGNPVVVCETKNTQEEFYLYI